jgi:hypothetical protein
LAARCERHRVDFALDFAVLAIELDRTAQCEEAAYDTHGRRFPLTYQTFAVLTVSEGFLDYAAILLRSPVVDYALRHNLTICVTFLPISRKNARNF